MPILYLIAIRQSMTLRSPLSSTERITQLSRRHTLPNSTLPLRHLDRRCRACQRRHDTTQRETLPVPEHHRALQNVAITMLNPTPPLLYIATPYLGRTTQNQTRHHHDPTMHHFASAVRRVSIPNHPYTKQCLASLCHCLTLLRRHTTVRNHNYAGLRKHFRHCFTKT